MHHVVTNLISALAISIVILAMSKLPSQRAKALLYTLPIPITIALIGSNGVGNSLSISGLMLTILFLWGCYYFHTVLKKNILLVDIALSVLYVLIGYVTVHILHVRFEHIIGVFAALWLVLMVIFRKRAFDYVPGKISQTPLWLKGSIIFAVAFLLFTGRDYLAAFVVTFPYNGVFAVYENRVGLYPQAALVTRNALALLAFFIANHYAAHRYGEVARYVLSWAEFAVVLYVVNNLIKIKIEQVTA